MRQLLIALTLLTAIAVTPFVIQAKPAAPAVKSAIDAAVAAPTRTPANLARDKYRNPAATLAFFGVKPTDTVVEIWPGGGWYTEILAPYITPKGVLYAATTDGSAAGISKKFTADTATYGKVKFATFPMQEGGTAVPPGSADVVLTFRNVHNWRMGYGRDGVEYSETAFRELFVMLKPGGVLGIEDHRLPENADIARERDSGYMKVSSVRAMAEKAGFQFAGESQVNANPRDTHDYPKGVWTLPPNFAEGETDRAKYAGIGESDRMTLKFIKPRK